MLLLKLANRCRNVANRICTKRFRISRAPITIRIRPKTIRNCKQNCWTIKSFTVASTKLSTSKCLCGIFIVSVFIFFFVEINFFEWVSFCQQFFGRTSFGRKYFAEYYLADHEHFMTQPLSKPTQRGQFFLFNLQYTCLIKR